LSRPIGKQTDTEPITEIEYRLVLTKLADHWRLFCELLWETGIRVGEALDVEKKDLEKHGVWITREKRADRLRELLSLSDSLYSRLYSYARYRRSDKVWPYTPQAAWLAIKKAAKDADCRTTIHPHSFRHAFGYRVINADLGAKTPAAHLRIAQELLGHKDSRSTLVYTQPTKADVEEARRKIIGYAK
jgi:integrase